MYQFVFMLYLGRYVRVNWIYQYKPIYVINAIYLKGGILYGVILSSIITTLCYYIHTVEPVLRWYLTLQGDNSLKSVECFDYMMFVCRFQASR